MGAAPCCACRIVVPYLGFWLRQRTGSWFAQIALSVVLKAVSGVVYCSWSSVSPARGILEAEDRDWAERVATKT